MYEESLPPEPLEDLEGRAIEQLVDDRAIDEPLDWHRYPPNWTRPTGNRGHSAPIEFSAPYHATAVDYRGIPKRRQ